MKKYKTPQPTLIRTDLWTGERCKTCRKPFERRAEVIEREDQGKIDRWCASCWFKQKI